MSGGCAELESALLRFVRGTLLPDAEKPIDADTYLFDDGLIDSLRILELVAFIETWLGREIRLSDITMRHFRSVAAIADHFGVYEPRRSAAAGEVR
jgi:acyl carrier protein